MGLMKSLFGSGKSGDQAVERVFESIMQQALTPQFFGGDKIPDTFSGRFDCVSLHAALVFRRLQGINETGAELAQVSTDRLFSGFDDALREIGTGDLTVSKKIKKVAEAYQGRAAAYRAALDDNAPKAAMADAIQRNIGLAEGAADRLAEYAVAVEAGLKAQANEELLKGVIDWSKVRLN